MSARRGEGMKPSDIVNRVTWFRVGDRVRRGPSGEVGTVFEVSKECGDYHVVFDRRSCWTDEDTLDLVERAHYAPVGVPMLALTPEVLGAIQFYLNDPAQCRTLVEEGVLCVGCKSKGPLRTALAAAEESV